MWLAAVYTYKPSTNNQYLYTYLPMLHVALLPTSIFFAMATYDALITKYLAIYSKSLITAASITEILPKYPDFSLVKFNYCNFNVKNDSNCSCE